MQLRLSDPEYTARLAEFLASLQLATAVAAPGRLEVLDDDPPTLEMEIYLRVWRVLYPDAEVDVLDAA